MHGITVYDAPLPGALRVREAKEIRRARGRYATQGEEKCGLPCLFVRMTFIPPVCGSRSKVSLYEFAQSGACALRHRSQPFSPVAQLADPSHLATVEEQIGFLAVWKCEEALTTMLSGRKVVR